jgi:hypothetical protein
MTKEQIQQRVDESLQIVGGDPVGRCCIIAEAVDSVHPELDAEIHFTHRTPGLQL